MENRNPVHNDCRILDHGLRRDDGKIIKKRFLDCYAMKNGKTMKINVVLLVALLSSSTVAFAEELTDAKKAAIKELMDMTGSAQIGEMFANAFLQQMTVALKSINPEIPPRAFTILEEEVNAVIREEMLEKDSLYELIYPIYHNYLTLEDTRELIAFYNTPVGRKMIRVMPQLTQESMQAGQAWGQSLGPIMQQRIANRLEKEGIK